MKTVITILIVILFLISCDFKPQVKTEYLDVTIDSISEHQRYTTIPSTVYYYHTSSGAIPTNHLNYKVGDKLKIKIINYNK